MQRILTILGPTATGKTRLAANLAKSINAEIISADSRQVYRGLNIGAGKDLNEYSVEGKQIPYHLIDICDIGEEYNVFKFQEDFHRSLKKISGANKNTILCGGTGLYIQSVLDGYKLYPVASNPKLRAELETKTQEELVAMLRELTKLHNVTDTSIKRRTIRAIEIAQYCKENNITQEIFPEVNSLTFGISLERRLLKEVITSRLKQRLENGMIEEVEGLIEKGISMDQLKFFGLEYKYLAQFISEELSYNDMFQKLNSAIHQFAKRQMTWFRRMEKQGHNIQWIDGNLDLEKKIELIKKRIKNVES